IVLVSITYLLGTIFCQKRKNQMTLDQQQEICYTNEIIDVNQLVVRYNDTDDAFICMCKLPGRKTRRDVRNLSTDLTYIQNTYNIDIIVTLNEEKDLSFMNTNYEQFDFNIYVNSIKSRNIQHIYHSIRDKFIAKSMRNYINFIFKIVKYIHD
ncbi:unnamed protein product, partial [Didymodactylos carnosus]